MQPVATAGHRRHNYLLCEKNYCQVRHWHDRCTQKTQSSMKVVAITLLVSLVLSSQLLAVLRPRFPEKADPPSRGNVIVIGDDSHRHPSKHDPRTADK